MTLVYFEKLPDGSISVTIWDDRSNLLAVHVMPDRARGPLAEWLTSNHPLVFEEDGR